MRIIFLCIYSTNMCLVASEKNVLEEMQTFEYIAMSRDYNVLIERRDLLRGIIHVCTQTLDSLTDCLSVSGLADLRGNALKEWLCDIGMSKLQTALARIDGNMLTMLTVSDVMEYDVTFNDASALLLRGYITYYKLNDGDFAPPRDTVLSWDEKQTANWIDSLGAPFARLAAIGWHGAALCSLSMPRVIEASKKLKEADLFPSLAKSTKLKAADAIKFIGLVRTMRSETDGDKATWVSKWSGTATIDLQSP